MNNNVLLLSLINPTINVVRVVKAAYSDTSTSVRRNDAGSRTKAGLPKKSWPKTLVL